MRAGALPTLAAVCAATAFIALFALPFAQVGTTDHDGDGSTTTETLWLRDVMQADQSAIPGGDPVYLIVATSVLLVGAVAFFVGAWGRTARMRWAHGAGGVTAALGAAMTIHGSALWAGRGVSSLFQRAGSFDGPPYEHFAVYRLYSPSVELYSSFTPVAPLVLLVVAIAVVAAVGFSWASRVAATRGLDTMARRHAWLAVVGALVLALALLVPWSSQILDDPVPPPEGQARDTDTYRWSAWDVHVINDATHEFAVERGEGGLIQYQGLSAALSGLAVAGLFLIVLPMVSLAGTHLSGRGQPVYGRLLENASFLTAAVLVVAAGIIVAGTFWLYDANEVVDSSMTGLPLLALVPAVAGAYLLVHVLRGLLAVDNDLVADDFPETVSYE